MSGFRANLSGASLADLVQFECLNRASGSFRITSGNAVGYLFFHQGEIVHAVTEQDVGEAAAIVILGWRDGTFEPCKLDLPEKATVTANWQHLLLRVAQLRDEADRSKLVSFPKRASTTPKAPPAAVPVTLPKPAQLPKPSLEAPPAPSMQAFPEPRDMVRLDPAGNVLSSQGNIETLAPSVAYMARMAGLVGELLALGPLQAGECIGTNSRILLHVEKSGNLVGLRTTSDSDVNGVRERFGL